MRAVSSLRLKCLFVSRLRSGKWFTLLPSTVDSNHDGEGGEGGSLSTIKVYPVASNAQREGLLLGKNGVHPGFNHNEEVPFVDERVTPWLQPQERGGHCGSKEGTPRIVEQNLGSSVHDLQGSL